MGKKRKRNNGEDGVEGGQEGELPENLGADGMPKKRFYRQRAHANPFSDHNLAYPPCSSEMDWSVHFPEHFSPPSAATAGASVGSTALTGKKVEWVDVGCGFGGLVCALAPMYPESLMLGMEIRMNVTQYVHDKIVALRKSNAGQYDNVSVIRANSMKFMPNFFEKGQLSKMFFLFPDPHFKARKHKARIITSTLLAEYAYVLRPGGLLYTITDVKDLNEWMVAHLDGFPLFERIPNEELVDDPVLEQVKVATEEGQKVARNEGLKMWAVYRRR